ncbi:MAG: hypothetical protein Q8M76_19190, partial [Spirochaetaceae bacterium]|nr:hypothetical protein [Spirochaetaceae bacterium]
MTRAAKRSMGPGRILMRFAATNFLIFLLPTAFALIYYRVSAVAIMRNTDDLAMSQLDAGLSTLDEAFAELRRSAARFSTDYEINLYLNKSGPLSGIETYNLRRIADKVAPLVYGSDLVSDCFIYFARSEMVAYESGFSPYADFYGPLLSVEGYGAGEWRKLILSSAEGESLLPGLRLTFGGRTFAATAALWPLGYGDHIRGAVVSIMDERNLTKPLEKLASEHKGWVAVLDGAGEVITIAGSGNAPQGLIDTVGEDGRAARSLRIGNASYRLYRSASST